MSEQEKDLLHLFWMEIWALLAPLAAWLMHPVISSVVKGKSGRGVRSAGIGYTENFF